MGLFRMVYQMAKMGLGIGGLQNKYIIDSFMSCSCIGCCTLAASLRHWCLPKNFLVLYSVLVRGESFFCPTCAPSKRSKPSGEFTPKNEHTNFGDRSWLWRYSPLGLGGLEGTLPDWPLLYGGGRGGGGFRSERENPSLA